MLFWSCTVSLHWGHTYLIHLQKSVCMEHLNKCFCGLFIGVFTVMFQRSLALFSWKLYSWSPIFVLATNCRRVFIIVTIKHSLKMSLWCDSSSANASDYIQVEENLPLNTTSIFRPPKKQPVFQVQVKDTKCS